MAAILTGSGGGIVRDLLAGRKPLVLKAEIYAVWAALGGLLVGLGLAQGALLYICCLSSSSYAGFVPTYSNGGFPQGLIFK